MPQDKLKFDGPISILNVGTKILLRDVMDQYLRSLGDIRTYYASTMKNALRFIQEHNIHILICETFLEDGSAERLLKALGPRSIQDELWFVLALESKEEQYISLALELGANSVLIKPFAASDLKNQVAKYISRNENQIADKGVDLIKEAEVAVRERRTNDADKKYREAHLASPQHFVVQYHCAQYFFTKPDYSLAEQCLKKALDTKPGFVPAMYLYGRLQMARGDLDSAYEYLFRAHKVSPLHAERAMVLAKYFVQRGAQMLATVMDADENHPMARFEMGKLMVLQKDYIGALVQLERAAESLEPEPFKECQTYMALARKLGNIVKG